jgi:probable phosphomutase (TIGR03848 family)
MPVVFLIRHGENDYIKKGRLAGRLPGVHLNEHGQQQAEAIAESLKKVPISSIHASPLERAVETAEPLAKALNLELQIHPGLQDTDVGEWQDEPLKKLRRLALWKQVQQNPSYVRFPGGESFLELQVRLVNTIENILTGSGKKQLLAVVFHADPIKLVIAHYLGLPLDNFQKLGISPGSVSILVTGKSGGYLSALNLRPPFVLGK